jgi:hypothetical protein
MTPQDTAPDNKISASPATAGHPHNRPRRLRQQGTPPAATGTAHTTPGHTSRHLTYQTRPKAGSQELIADLSVHVGAKPAAHLIEQQPAVGV